MDRTVFPPPPSEYELNLQRLRDADVAYLAWICSKSTTAMRGYLRGDRTPSADVLAKMASALGVHPGELYRRAEQAIAEAAP